MTDQTTSNQTSKGQKQMSGLIHRLNWLLRFAFLPATLLCSVLSMAMSFGPKNAFGKWRSGLIRFDGTGQAWYRPAQYRTAAK